MRQLTSVRILLEYLLLPRNKLIQEWTLDSIPGAGASAQWALRL